MSKRSLFVLPLLLPLGACVLMSGPPGQMVQVVTDPPAASCDLMTDRGKVSVMATPSVVLVPVGRGDMTVICQAKGFEPAMLTVENFARNFVPEPVVQRSLGRHDLQQPTPVHGYPDLVRMTLTPAPEPVRS